MFASLPATFTFASLALLAVATPNGKRWATPTTTVSVAPPGQTGGSGSCSTGAIQCCSSTETADSAAGSTLLDLLGVVVEGVGVVLGLGCSPISVIGVGDSGCNSNVVCCQDNAVGGLISIGCLPVSL